MREFIIAFRSRSDAVRYYELLQEYRVSARLINTPSSAGTGCGLSVKMFIKDMPRAKVVLDRGRFASVIDFFYFNQDGKAVKM